MVVWYVTLRCCNVFEVKDSSLIPFPGRPSTSHGTVKSKSRLNEKGLSALTGGEGTRPNTAPSMSHSSTFLSYNSPFPAFSFWMFKPEIVTDFGYPIQWPDQFLTATAEWGCLDFFLANRSGFYTLIPHVLSLDHTLTWTNWLEHSLARTHTLTLKFSHLNTCTDFNISLHGFFCVEGTVESRRIVNKVKSDLQKKGKQVVISPVSGNKKVCLSSLTLPLSSLFSLLAPLVSLLKCWQSL